LEVSGSQGKSSFGKLYRMTSVRHMGGTTCMGFVLAFFFLFRSTVDFIGRIVKAQRKSVMLFNCPNHAIIYAMQSPDCYPALRLMLMNGQITPAELAMADDARLREAKEELIHELQNPKPGWLADKLRATYPVEGPPVSPYAGGVPAQQQQQQ
jgi:hypothetical protein